MLSLHESFGTGRYHHFQLNRQGAASKPRSLHSRHAPHGVDASGNVDDAVSSTTYLSPYSFVPGALWGATTTNKKIPEDQVMMTHDPTTEFYSSAAMSKLARVFEETAQWVDSAIFYLDSQFHRFHRYSR